MKDVSTLFNLFATEDQFFSYLLPFFFFFLKKDLIHERAADLEICSRIHVPLLRGEHWEDEEHTNNIFLP